MIDYTSPYNMGDSDWTSTYSNPSCADYTWRSFRAQNSEILIPDMDEPSIMQQGE